MEPKSSSQFEQGGAPIEFQPTPLSPESLEGQRESHERQTNPQEQASQSIAPVVIPTNIPLPTPVQPQVQQQLADDNPALAADEDLIEKEWVDKAKKIIATTKDDPYRREKEVARLQSDYLQKRYGKTLGKDE